MTEPVSIPPTTEWPPVMLQYLRACAWSRLLAYHEGVGGVMQWLFAGQKHPLTGERLSYGITTEALYPIVKDAADAWAVAGAAKRSADLAKKV